MSTTTVHTPAATRLPMDPMRRRSLAAGILYLITFVSVPSLALYKPIKDQVGDFVLGAGSGTGVMWAALSEVVVGLAGVGTAIVLFPVLRRQSETPALGFVAARIVEATLIFVGVISVLSIVTLRNDVAGTAGADPASLVTIAQTHLATYNWTFLLSQSLMPVFCDLLLGYLLFRSRLVPRILPIVAFVGAPLLLASDIAIFFVVYDRVAPLAGVAVIPVAAFELSVGIWLLVKGFNPTSPVLTRPNTEVAIPTPRTGEPHLDERGSELVR
jgi:hypothetical protein